MSWPRQLPDDPALPALPDLFPASGPPAFVMDALREMCGSPANPARARIGYVRYRALKSCVVLWRMRVADGRRFWISARMFHDGRGVEVVARASFGRLVSAARDAAGIGGAPYAYDAERRVLLQLFPLDTRMPALLTAGAQDAMGERFSHVLQTEARVASATPVSYKPWRRCVYRYGVEAGGESRFFYGKLFLDDRGAQLLAWQRAIESRMREADAPWRIVHPVAHLPDERLLLIEAVDGGTEVRDMIKEAAAAGAPGPDLLDVLERVAAGLPAFQSTELPGLDEMPPRAIVEDYAHGAAGLDAVVPELAASMSGLLGRLDGLARTLPPETQVPSHGAFRYDQFISADGDLAAIDLDTLCLSGVSADAGNFLGYLDVMGVRRPGLRAAVEACAAAFERAALRLPGVTPEWLAWYRAAAHVKKALRAFYSLDPKWPRVTAELAEHASRALASRTAV